MQILKLGGSVLTKKDGLKEVDERNLENLTTMLAGVWKRKRDLILVHGAGSFGHPQVIYFDLNKGVRREEDKKNYCSVHSSCEELSLYLVESLIDKGVPAISIHPALVAKQSRREKFSFNEKPVFEYFSHGYLPVLHGDVVLDKKIGGSVCSGDRIVGILGKKAKRIIFGTNVDGLIIEGKLIKRIKRKDINSIKKYIGKSYTIDVTGGMLGKIEEVIQTSKPCYIVNALYPERIERVLLGKKTVCTEIVPK